MGLSHSQDRGSEVFLANGTTRTVKEARAFHRNWVEIDSRMFDPNWSAKLDVAGMIVGRMKATGENYWIAATRLSTVTSGLPGSLLISGLVQKVLTVFRDLVLVGKFV